jgi:hypothetical protein
VNRLVRNWGHVFLYDEPTLRGALADAGFSAIVRVAPGESSHPALSGIDRHEQEVGKDPNERETLALEATASVENTPTSHPRRRCAVRSPSTRWPRKTQPCHLLEIGEGGDGYAGHDRTRAQEALPPAVTCRPELAHEGARQHRANVVAL